MTELADVDPSLLLASDLLVLEALTRAWARTVKRSGRGVPAAARHNQYLRIAVPEDRIDAILHDAWVLCPLLAQRHDLSISPTGWAQALDAYTRALLLMSQNHTPGRLRAALAAVDAADLGPVGDG